MKRSIKHLVFTTVLILSLCVNAFAGSGTSLNEGDTAPDFTLKNMLTDKDVSLSDYKGKIVVLQFWATWCALCKREIPYLVKHYNANKSRGDFEIIAILLPSGDKDQKTVEKLVEKYKIPYTIVLDKDNKVSGPDGYGLKGPIPVLVVVDQEGLVYYEHVGEVPPQEDVLEFILEELRGEVEE